MWSEQIVQVAEIRGCKVWHAFNVSADVTRRPLPTGTLECLHHLTLGRGALKVEHRHRVGKGPKLLPYERLEFRRLRVLLAFGCRDVHDETLGGEAPVQALSIPLIIPSVCIGGDAKVLKHRDGACSGFEGDGAGDCDVCAAREVGHDLSLLGGEAHACRG